MSFRAFWVDWETHTYFVKIFCECKAQNAHKQKEQDTWGSEATKNASAKLEAQGNEATENTSEKHVVRGNEATENAIVKHKAWGNKATENVNAKLKGEKWPSSPTGLVWRGKKCLARLVLMIMQQTF